MKDEKSAETNKLTFDCLTKNPLASIMEYSSVPWAIKDNQSRFVYINQAGVDFLDVP